MVGVDEVGRGCWAGPLLVVAARAKTKLPKGLKDSKLLSPRQRLALCTLIEQSCELGEGWVTALEIDTWGLSHAMRLAVKRALLHLRTADDEDIIIDGTVNYCPVNFTKVQAIAKADNTHPIVSAASIYAKVRRDAFMAKIAQDYPEYGFESHVGYGTAQHRTALEAFGLTELHRRSYKPVQAWL